MNKSVAEGVGVKGKGNAEDRQHVNVRASGEGAAVKRGEAI